MGWKSTKTISRKEIEEKISKEIIYRIEDLSDDTLCGILELLGEDESTEVYAGYNYRIENN